MRETPKAKADRRLPTYAIIRTYLVRRDSGGEQTTESPRSLVSVRSMMGATGHPGAARCLALAAVDRDLESFLSLSLPTSYVVLCTT